MTKRNAFALVLAAAAFGAAVSWRVKPDPKLEPVVMLPDSALARSVPTPPKGLEKVTRTTVKPAQVATSEGTPGKAVVLRYCAPTLEARTFGDGASLTNTPSLVRDSASPVPPKAAATLPPFAGKFHDKQLELHATLSDGSLWRATYRVRPPLEWGSDGDSVWVEQDRWLVRFTRDAVTCGKRAAVGGLIGGAIVGILANDARAGAIAGGSVGCLSVLD